VTPVALPGLLARDKFTADASGNLWMFTLDGKLWRQPAGGAWVNVAGTTYGSRDGPGADAQFGELLALCTDRQGNCYGLDVFDPEHDGVDIQCHVRKITPAGVTSTVGGNLTTGITYPITLAVNSSGMLFFASGNTVVQMNAQGQTTVIGGTASARGTADGDSGKATFSFPGAITVDRQDSLFVVDDSGATLRRGTYLGLTPGITTQPQSQTVAAGETVTFSVAASGDAVTYQWHFNGSAFQGGTTSSLRLTNVRASDAGDYSVVVTNAAGSITSNKATLTISGTGGNPSNPPASGGGGGAPSLWFVSALGALLGFRSLRICFRRAP
jgi:hypothetical protein